MLRIEGNLAGRFVAAVIAIVAVAVLWVAQAPAAHAAPAAVNQWTSSGPEGGPFSPDKGSVDITNVWNTNVRWYATGDTSWIRIKGFNGKLKPGASRTVQVYINDQVAKQLSTGTYKCELSAYNPSNGVLTAMAECILTVKGGGSPGQIAVSPTDSFQVQGQEGGSFAPLSKTYAVSNSGGQPIGWRVEFDHGWVSTTGPGNGQLQPGASQNVPLKVDPAYLATLPMGKYVSRARFFDAATNVQVASRDVVVTVQAATSAGQLDVTPVDAFMIQGEQGGVFTPLAKTYTMSNSGGQPLDFRIEFDDTWVWTSSPTTGQLQPGQSQEVNLQVSSAHLAGLPVGQHASFVRFFDAGQNIEVTSREVSVNVKAATAGKLEVNPLDSFQISGEQGGVFSPLSKTYTLSNTGNKAVNWRVTFDDPWVMTSANPSGQLPPGANQNLPLQVDTGHLVKLSIGQHKSRVRFIDNDQGIEVTSREVVVNVKSTSSGNGWTQFTPSPDTRIVYVSSSQGNDANDGLSEAKPKRTIGAGKNLLRDGYPDWLLLKKGDTWNEGFGQWKTAGRSPSEPLLVSSYGNGSRPQINPGSGANGFSIFTGTVHDIAVVDLHFRGDPGNLNGDGFAWLSNNKNGLVEGCLFEYFGVGVDLQGPDNVVVRRNVIAYAGHNAMYVVNVSGLLIEENVIDQIALQAPDIFKQGIYLDNEGNTGMVVRGNIVSNVSSHGLQLRPGGLAENNLFVRTSIALELGGGDSWAANSGGVVAQALNNVILDGKNISPSTPRGWGILMQNVASALVEGNVIANAPLAGNPRPIEVDGWENGKRVHNVTLRNNTVTGWGGNGLRVKGDPGTSVKNLVVDSNDFQNAVDSLFMMEVDNGNTTSEITSQKNRFFSAPLASNKWFLIGGTNNSIDGFKSKVGDSTSTAVQVNYPNPGVSVGNYNASLGKASSHDAFMAEARKQSRDFWRPEYSAVAVNAWVRAALGK